MLSPHYFLEGWSLSAKRCSTVFVRFFLSGRVRSLSIGILSAALQPSVVPFLVHIQATGITFSSQSRNVLPFCLRLHLFSISFCQLLTFPTAIAYLSLISIPPDATITLHLSPGDFARMLGIPSCLAIVASAVSLRDDQH